MQDAPRHSWLRLDHSQAASDRLILNAGEKEFAARLLLVGCMRTKTLQGLSFLPWPNYERFLQMSKSSMFITRKEDEERLKPIEHQTVEKYRNSDSVDYEE